MKSRFAIACFLAGALTVPAAAYANDTVKHTQANRTTTATEAKSADAKEAVSDSAITTKIKSKMATTKGVSATHIKVDTDNGVVHLSGTARDQAEKDQAVQIARDTKGVTSVDDKITVGR
jgi:hyperosmotically inducible periplasmic protein